MYSRLLLPILVSQLLIPSLASGQDSKQKSDPEVNRLKKLQRALQERIDHLAKEVKALEAQQAKVKAKAKEDPRLIVADAKAQAKELKGRARAEADRILNEAHNKDPELYLFLKKVAAMKTILESKKTILLIPGKSKFLWQFLEPPKQEKKAKKSPKDKTGPAKGSAKQSGRFDKFKKIWQEEFARALRKMRDQGRLEVLPDNTGVQGLDIILPKRPAPKK
jgi:cell division septum initiation protein DivIVA